MTTTDIVGSVCGRCLAQTEARHQPSACFTCGAIYDLAPYALIHVEIDTVAEAGSIAVAPRIEVEFVGPWDVRTRERIRGALGIGG